MDGSIFAYNSAGSIAFRNCIQSNMTMIFIGGLGANILDMRYIQDLNQLCISRSISLVIPQLRSHPNHSIFPIESDIEDVASLVAVIRGDILIIGHSTGCQDALLYLRKHGTSSIKGVVLQGPVSDIECSDDPEMENNLERAMLDGCTRYIEFEESGIWLKERYLSLYQKRGKEDLFSSYLEDEHFAQWKDMLPILSILSGRDQYCSSPLVDKFEMMGRVRVIKDADHELSKQEWVDEFIGEIDSFLNEIKFCSCTG